MCHESKYHTVQVPRNSIQEARTCLHSLCMVCVCVCVCVCSTILRLEEEVRHLQHVNNRLNSLSTHYQFGCVCVCGLSSLNAVSFSSQHPISRDKTTPPSPPPITYNTASTPPSPSPITSKIARRKWLEASDPGLICGGAPAPGPNGPHPSPSQQSQEMAESTLRAIRTGNIIPDVKKLQGVCVCV